MSSLDILIRKLAGASSSVADPVEETQLTPATTTTEEVKITDPVYVEKLASAVDFIVDNWATGDFVAEDAGDAETTQHSSTPEVEDTVVKTASEGKPETAVAGVSALLKKRLQEKFSEKDAEKTAAVAASKEKLAKALVGKIQGMKSGSPTEPEERLEATFEDAVVQALSTGTEELNLSESKEDPPNEESNEGEVKAAGIEDQTLADVLNTALGSIEPNNESAPEQSAKTAGVRGGKGSSARKEATQRLKEKLMAKVGEEA